MFHLRLRSPVYLWCFVLGLSVGDVIVLNYIIRVVGEGDVERVVDTTVKNIARRSGMYDPSRRYRVVS